LLAVVCHIYFASKLIQNGLYFYSREEYLEQVIVNKAMVEGEKSKQESLVTSGEMLTVTKEQNIWTRTRPAYDAAMAEREMFKHIRKEKDANDMRLSDAIKSNQVPKQ
jgi:hypothetical protein